MLGFKNYDSAVTTITGIELFHRIRKGQFSLDAYTSKIKLRLQSGMPFSPPKNATSSQPCLGPYGCLHQSLFLAAYEITTSLAQDGIRPTLLDGIDGGKVQPTEGSRHLSTPDA